MEERHKAILLKQNPLWTGGTFDVPPFTRDLYASLEKYLPPKQVLALVGLRRVGKTVLVKQLLKSIKAAPANLGYISFDDRDFQRYETAYELIDYFLQHSDPTTKRYLVLDEIQKVPQWSDLVKTFYDTEMNLKFIISGSSSLELKRYKETLAGRLLSFSLPVFTFKEFVRFHALPSSLSLKNLSREYDFHFRPQKYRYEQLFEQYIIQGAFPELLGVEDEEYVKKYIFEVIDKITADIAKNIDPGKDKEIYELVLLFCKSTGRLFEINNLSSLLKINRNTLSRYLQLLEKAFLLKIGYNFTPSIAKRLRVSRKGYIAHSCISIALLNYPRSLLAVEGSERGHLVETALVSTLPELSFWRQQQAEIDLVLPDKTPVEIKFQQTISAQDTEQVLSFMEKYRVSRGIIVTKELMQVKKIGNKELLFLPAWCYLLQE